MRHKQNGQWVASLSEEISLWVFCLFLFKEWSSYCSTKKRFNLYEILFVSKQNLTHHPCWVQFLIMFKSLSINILMNKSRYIYIKVDINSNISGFLIQQMCKTIQISFCKILYCRLHVLGDISSGRCNF